MYDHKYILERRSQEIVWRETVGSNGNFPTWCALSFSTFSSIRKE